MATVSLTRQFEISGVFRRMVTGISAHWKVLLGIAVGVGILVSISAGVAMPIVLHSVDPKNPHSVLTMFVSPVYWLVTAASILLNAFALSAMLGALLHQGDENEFDFASALTSGTRDVLPMIGLTLLWMGGILLGYILLFVPALMLLTMWSVSAPSLIAERTGVIAAFGRSRELTKGIRWPIFGALLLFAISYVFVAFALRGFPQPGTLDLYKTNTALSFAINLVSSSFLGILLSAFLAGLYGEVLEAKEGGSQNRLSEVFS